MPDARLKHMLLNLRRRASGIPLLASLVAFGLTGCASPGVPRSPSLNLPAFAADLAATRQGTTVTLRFTVSQRNTDHLPLRGSAVTAKLCRAIDPNASNLAACLPIAGLATQSFAPLTAGHATVAELHDTLPPGLTTGPPRLLAYRVEIFNDAGHTAGFSDPAYTAAGAAPPAVTGLSVQGSRLGVVLAWNPATPDASQVVLRREDLNPKPAELKEPAAKPASVAKPSISNAKSGAHGNSQPPTATRIKEDADPNVVWLRTAPSEAITLPNTVLDAAALPDEPYRYAAERRRSVQLGGRTLELRSDPSTAISFTLHDVYPPPPPTDLTAASFIPPSGSSSLQVDLIWQPVDDPGLAGYIVYRQPIDTTGTPTGPIARLNKIPIPLPGFHDEIPTPPPGSHYRYSVTSVDAKANESAPCSMTLDPAQP